MKRFEELKTMALQGLDVVNQFFIDSYDSIAAMINSL